jgi:hypothetical protein
MHERPVYRLAGPMDHPGVDQAARNARNMIMLRDRVRLVAHAALPQHKRRPAKGRGRWPGNIPLSSI